MEAEFAVDKRNCSPLVKQKISREEKMKEFLKKAWIIVLSAMSAWFFFTGDVFAMDQKNDGRAIVLAQFGTSYPSALRSLLDIQKNVQSAFPGVKVKLAFTSNIIRKIWHERQNDKRFLAENKGISREILEVKAPLATLADLQDDGYNTIIVQSNHVMEGEEYLDLKALVHALDSIETIKPAFRPFRKVALGRPLLGEKGKKYPYRKDLETAAKAVRSDVELAAKNSAALVYMGHGNEHLSTGVYAEFQETMRRLYPSTPICVGTVEGFPDLDGVVAELERYGIKKVLLKPFMIVAGDHATNDMAGDEKDSWKSVFQARGIEVIPVLEGLGVNHEISSILIQHIRDVARDSHIAM